MIARRTFLAGGSAALLGGCDPRAAATRALERLHGCVDVAIPPAAGVRVVRGLLPTVHVKAPVRFAVAIPAAATRLDAVAYLLPGRGSSADAAIGLGFDGFLAEHLRQGGRPFAIAAIDAGESYFHARANGEDRLAAATVDLPRVVRSLLGVPALREAIMGQSMGGYGALLAASREPHRFRAVAVAGPAIFPSFADEDHSVGDAFDSAADYARNDVTRNAAALRDVPVQVMVGRRDPFLPGVRRFAAACANAQFTVTDGCHDDGFWRWSAPSSLAFVAQHLVPA